MGGILPNQMIIQRHLETPLFDVFYKEKQLFNGKSYGVSQCGYDVRCKQDLTIYPVSLKNLFLKSIGIKRDSFVLASTIEKFNIPKDIAACVLDKSTWARTGLAVQNTIAEPGWRGWLTLELTNHSDNIITVLKGEPIAQVLFHVLVQPTEVPYPEDGKYQDQSDEPVNPQYENSNDYSSYKDIIVTKDNAFDENGNSYFDDAKGLPKHTLKVPMPKVKPPKGSDSPWKRTATPKVTGSGKDAKPPKR